MRTGCDVWDPFAETVRRPTVSYGDTPGAPGKPHDNTSGLGPGNPPPLRMGASSCANACVSRVTWVGGCMHLHTELCWWAQEVGPLQA